MCAIIRVIFIAIVCVALNLIIAKHAYAVDGEVTYTSSNTNLTGDDSSAGPFNIGFNFDLYDHTYTQFYVNINGSLNFDSGFSTYGNSALNSSTADDYAIYPFWDDLITNTQAGVKPIYYHTIGVAPNRKCIIQWTNVYFFGTTIQMGTFQAILYETSNNIQIQYRDLLGGDRAKGNSATIGIKRDNTTYEQTVYGTATLSQEQAILYTPNGSSDYNVNTSADYELVYLAPAGAPGTPSLVNPTNGTTGSTVRPTFEWLAASNAEDYTLFVSTQSDFSSTVINQSSINGLNYTLGSDLNYNTQYYWRVQADNEVSSTLSPSRTFTTAATPNTIPDIPSNVSSDDLISGDTINSAINTSINMDLTDDDSNEQVRYRIQISSDNTFSNLVIDYRSPFGNTGTKTYTFAEDTGTYLVGSSASVLSDGSYYLRIRAEDDSADSSNWYTPNEPAFTVQQTYIVTNPPADTIISLQSDWATDVTSNGQTGTQTIGIEKDTFRVATFDVEFTANQDWSNLTAQANGTKSVLHYPGGFSSIPGNSGSGFTLYVPYKGGNRVRICPNATDVNEVSSGCSGEYFLTTANNNVSITTEDSIVYWKVSGLTGTGGEDGGSVAQSGSAPDITQLGLYFTLGIILIAGTYLNKKINPSYLE